MNKKYIKGFTLIELIVSILVFSVALYGIVLFTASNSSAAIKSERKAKTIMLQEKVVEEYRSFLMHSATGGQRFDSTWNNTTVGTVLYKDKTYLGSINDTLITNIEVAEFIPDSSASPSEIGSRMRVRIISKDARLNNSDTSYTFISKHR